MSKTYTITSACGWLDTICMTSVCVIHSIFYAFSIHRVHQFTLILSHILMLKMGAVNPSQAVTLLLCLQKFSQCLHTKATLVYHIDVFISSFYALWVTHRPHIRQATHNTIWFVWSEKRSTGYERWINAIEDRNIDSVRQLQPNGQVGKNPFFFMRQCERKISI